jgi:hypothetical protein
MYCGSLNQFRLILLQECRWVPRVRRMPGNQSHCEPHIDTAGCISNIICFCDLCDEGVELGLPFHLSEFCDCSQYKRWICLPCSHNELLTWAKYVDQGGAQERWDYEEAYPQRRHEEGLWINHVPEGMTVSPGLYITSLLANYYDSSGVLVGKEFLPPASLVVDGVEDD